MAAFLGLPPPLKFGLDPHPHLLQLLRGGVLDLRPSQHPRLAHVLCSAKSQHTGYGTQDQSRLVMASLSVVFWRYERSEKIIACPHTTISGSAMLYPPPNGLWLLPLGLPYDLLHRLPQHAHGRQSASLELERPQVALLGRHTVNVMFSGFCAAGTICSFLPGTISPRPAVGSQALNQAILETPILAYTAGIDTLKGSEASRGRVGPG
jgi:hypothetical protein